MFPFNYTTDQNDAHPPGEGGIAIKGGARNFYMSKRDRNGCDIAGVITEFNPRYISVRGEKSGAFAFHGVTLRHEYGQDHEYFGWTWDLSPGPYAQAGSFIDGEGVVVELYR